MSHPMIPPFLAVSVPAALLLTGCIIVVDKGDDGSSFDGFVTQFDADATGPLEVAIEETLQPFDGIDASAGTVVTVIAGDGRRIRLDARAAERTQYEFKGDSLRITCKQPCRNSGSRGRVEVVTPDPVTAASVSSGAMMTFDEGFERVTSLSLAVSSGGSLDAQGVPAQNVTATASSGGSLLLHADGALTASASSGGSIKYHGEPKNITRAESSGGSIRSDR